MLGVALSFGKNGLQDWVVQRITAIFLALYIFFFIGFFILNPNPSYSEWHLLFSSFWMKTTTSIVIISIIVHAWIGIWTVITDYIHIISLRLIVQILFILGLLGCLFFAFNILWRS
jgi:succinate dehydrogenase / fumarate reductase, membrane anchor subunit